MATDLNQTNSKVHSKGNATGAGRHAIDLARTRDRERLLGLWSKWNHSQDDGQAQSAFESALQDSIAQRQARAAALPSAAVDPQLPIAAEAARIVDLIRTQQVVVIAGETGSGKTTQLPKLCLAAGRGAAGIIGCTQPRRIAARSVARRVAEELQVPLGGAVGYQVRFNEQLSEHTVVKFMTDGILLAEISSDRWLSAYDTLIIDEAHERSLNIDFLLGYLRQLLERRPDLKLIVTSATIDTERFAAHFGNALVVQVEGRGYPVEVRYRPLDGSHHEPPDLVARDSSSATRMPSQTRSLSMIEGIIAACDEIVREQGQGDILVFLPGEREIREAHRALERRRYRHTEILPLYARLSARDQDRVFHSSPQRRIVLATNVAETSLTVPRIHYVVDPGLARIKRYSPRQKLDRLQIEPISQASAEQRKGRCGRIAAGVCIRLYSDADFAARAPYTDPEIRRAALAGVILRMLTLGLGQIERFAFLEPPDSRAVADGWQQLSELGAIDAQRKPTSTGKTMANLPVDVKLGRMLVAANALDCVREMLIITSFLAVQDPRERPPDARAAADDAHAQFADPKSEFIGILKLWSAYNQACADLTQSQLRKWAQRHFFGFLRLREWRELHRQLKLQCEALWDAPGEIPRDTAVSRLEHKRVRARSGDTSEHTTSYAQLHKALITGLPTQIGQHIERGVYQGPRGRKFQLFPGSTLAKQFAGKSLSSKIASAKSIPSWVLCATLLDTDKVWALTNAAIEPDWVIEVVPHLLSRRQHDPRWSRAQGRVIGSEQIALFGLILAPKRAIHYGALHPAEARELFLRDALVAGEIKLRAAFLARNLRTLDTAKQEEAKLRRSGVVIDEDAQAQWYHERIPARIISAQALDAWYARLTHDEKAALEWSHDQLLVDEETDALRFPSVIVLGDARLAVHYRFDPGAADDGMTVTVPLHLLNVLDPDRLSWLAPGMVQDKAVAMIKSLPKTMRRNFVPAPDFAKAFAHAHAQARTQTHSIEAALAGFLSRLTGVEVAASEFDPSAIEPYLHANLRLIDIETGREPPSVLAESRDLEQLRADFGARAARAFAAHAAQDLARTGLTTFPDSPIPQSIRGAGGVPAWPALQDDGDSVSLAVHAERHIAERLHPPAVRRLLSFALAEPLKRARKQLPVQQKTALLYAAIESNAQRNARVGDRLREDLVDGAFNAVAADQRPSDQSGGSRRDALGDIRDPDSFARKCEQVRHALFPEAMRRLEQAEAILLQAAQVRAKLDGPLLGWARANLDDIQAQLDALVGPGFLREVPAKALIEYPRWLKALELRIERALHDPTRDQMRMLELQPFADAVAQGLGTHAFDPQWQALRWSLEELRVATYAQELAVKGGLSQKKFAARIAQLQRGSR